MSIKLRAAVAWGVVVLGMTLVILVLGAIVLPAQAYIAPAKVLPQMRGAGSRKRSGQNNSERVRSKEAGNEMFLPRR